MTLVGGRGMASRLGTAKSGGIARADGWEVGGAVWVTPDPDFPDRDMVAFYATDGSKASMRRDPVAVIRQDIDGTLIITSNDEGSV